MIPNFNPNKWDKQKVIDYVIGNEPLNDQQIAFLVYFEKVQQENDDLKEMINKANKILSETLVVKQGDMCRPIKNTTKQDAYRAIYRLYRALETPYRGGINE